MTATDRVAPIGASQNAIEFHYDVSNEFYRLWLDEHMVYSCALWEDGDSLDKAQLRKLDYLAKQIGTPNLARVLDVGCGWGGLLSRLTQVHGVQHAVGLTLSRAQADYLDGMGLSNVEVRVESWADHRKDETYDGIISIGAFEHFAKPGLSRLNRVLGYRAFFSACCGWLQPGQFLAIQTVAKGDNVRLDRSTLTEMRFVMERVFPESELPWLSEIIEAAERRFTLINLRNDGQHYAKTASTWLARLRRNAASAELLVGAERLAEYDRYLESFGKQFEQGHVKLVRLTFQRV